MFKYTVLYFILAAAVVLGQKNVPQDSDCADGFRRTPGDAQVVYLPALLSREAQYEENEEGAPDVAIDYSFDALGRNFDLKLVPNRRLLSPHFKVFSSEGEEERYEEVLSEVEMGCHYMHHGGGGTVAAISTCRDRHLEGLIFVDNSTFELVPLTDGENQTRRWDARRPHVIRRALPPPEMDDDIEPLSDVRYLHPARRANKYIKNASYVIELALFLDEAAYNTFNPYFNNNKKDLIDMLLAYINGVQALYHHASLGARVELSLVRLQLLKSQPSQLSTHGGDSHSFLDSFCQYQVGLNRKDDAHPDHWDMALLLSGLDLHSTKNGQRSFGIMGLAPVEGICYEWASCVVTELGSTDSCGRPYPSAGFTSVYILAHEIGHNLGMHHDGSGNTCSPDEFIMSPSRGTGSKAAWSHCSAQVITELGWATCLQDQPEAVRSELVHDHHGDAPGITWGVKRQCEVFLRDPDAVPMVSGADPEHCRQLQCRTPRTAGYYFAGPALPGTSCGNNMWCQGGECVLSGQQPGGATRGSTSSGSEDERTCRSGCLLRSRGYKELLSCAGAADSCEGAGYDVVLCDDSKFCGKKTRLTAIDLASRKCAEFASKLPQLDAKGGGRQSPHDSTQTWMGCAIFCRRVNESYFFTPRMQLKDVGVNPYFPDGTWCHHDGLQDYYCLQHQCLPAVL